MKVYLIMEGEYSDIHVRCVTTSAKVANKLKTIWTDCWVEEYETDTFTIPETSTYEVRFSFDGKFESIVNVTEICQRTSADNVVMKKRLIWYANDNPIYFIVTVNSENIPKAKKKAFDMLAEFKARKEWIT